jgi:hypothetical protein
LHQGNIWFRRLVRSNRALYKTCPKHTKLLVAKAVVKAVQGQNPSGRYLETDKATGGWKEIQYRRALDKTSQALREKDPNPDPEYDQYAREAAASASKESSLDILTEVTLQQAGLSMSGPQPTISKPAANEKTSKKRKEPTQFQKPSWWNRGTPIVIGAQSAAKPSYSGMQPAAKKNKTETQEEDVPLPVDALQMRQSSIFNFLNTTGIFGSPSKSQRSHFVPGSNNANGNTKTNGLEPLDVSSLYQGTRNNNPNSNFGLQNQQEQYYQGETNNVNNSPFGMQQPNLQVQNSLVDVFEPLPMNQAENSGRGNFNNDMTMDQMIVRQQMQMLQQNQRNNGQMLQQNQRNNGFGTLKTAGGFVQASSNNVAANNTEEVAAPPKAGLTSQMSDWLTSFFPPAGDEGEAKAPPPPQQNLQRGISSTIFNLARSPSQFLTNLKSGVTSVFTDNSPGNPGTLGQMGAPAVPKPAGLTSQNHSLGSQSQNFGIPSETRMDSLLDDTEDTPLETQFRNGRSL